jgi:hypothetical protein
VTIMLLAMTCLSAVVAVAAADIVRRNRREADLRRRWRHRPRQPWRLN